MMQGEVSTHGVHATQRWLSLRQLHQQNAEAPDVNCRGVGLSPDELRGRPPGNATRARRPVVSPRSPPRNDAMQVQLDEPRLRDMDPLGLDLLVNAARIMDGRQRLRYTAAHVCHMLFLQEHDEGLTRSMTRASMYSVAMAKDWPSLVMAQPWYTARDGLAAPLQQAHLAQQLLVVLPELCNAQANSCTGRWVRSFANQQLAEPVELLVPVQEARPILCKLIELSLYP
eukprot:CAMPEP_0114628854 /NCGR_PEP_ID=MMETSP0168-20121206/13045_1 /TAXON_ID=95228 ORGANISM="Vannella sp., Strain DIVA3 517/6/12" /NCGR_SAMPLE_ID=MMETSP0168 /ASSEMBLY_ACC=CAM_ASM_000044 /LENGTH=227 /DNA_ID=CAMNT_0001840269 /DNA_START=238 /DNA_END=921 /DNA_ORIENTATION=-